MALYQEYRPVTLKELKGNDDTIATLSKMLEDVEKAPHVYMLNGPTGCGKTTIGRIIANELGSIGTDFREINSADFRGIDMVRDIVEKSQYLPIEGRCIVWLIDEVHQLTSAAQEAFLKILEDTPDHVYFILCTTDPQKLKATLKGRCSVFQMKPLTNNQMFGLLRTVAWAKGEKLEKVVLDTIVELAEGLPRNALQVLEQVLATSEENRLEVATNFEAKKDEVFKLYLALISHKGWKEVMTLLTSLKGEDPEGIRRLMLACASNALLKKDDMRAGAILEAFEAPMYDILWPGVVLACYRIVKGIG